tara:strand:+ start:357 stop:578 length:222 start_codon:yes stop_codon:yes gene_type:complete
MSGYDALKGIEDDIGEFFLPTLFVGLSPFEGSLIVHGVELLSSHPMKVADLLKHPAFFRKSPDDHIRGLRYFL